MRLMELDDRGATVAFVVDAMTDRDADNHRHCVEKVFPCFGQSGTTDHVLQLLSKKPLKRR